MSIKTFREPIELVEDTTLNLGTPLADETTFSVKVTVNPKFPLVAIPWRGLFRIDVSLLATVTVLDAQLRIACSTADNRGRSAYVERCTRPGVVIAEATKTLYATGSSWASPLGDFTAEGGVAWTTPTEVDTYTEIDVTALVQDAIANQNNLFIVGLILNPESPFLIGDPKGAEFYSSEDPTLRPELVVTYEGVLTPVSNATFISKDSSDTNFDDQTHLRVGSKAGEQEFRTFFELKYDAAQGATAASASLRLFIKDVSGSSAGKACKVYRMRAAADNRASQMDWESGGGEPQWVHAGGDIGSLATDMEAGWDTYGDADFNLPTDGVGSYLLIEGADLLAIVQNALDNQFGLIQIMLMRAFEFISIRNASYKWTKNGATDEYYCEDISGGDPGLSEPWSVYLDGAHASDMQDPAVVGSLAAGTAAWGGSGETWGFDTVVVRLADDADPDGKATDFVQWRGVPDADEYVDFWSDAPGVSSQLRPQLKVMLTGSITDATQADPVVITSANHGLLDGQKISITGVGGMVELNDREFIVVGLTADTFELVGEDGTGHTAYSSGGTWLQIDIVDRQLIRGQPRGVTRGLLRGVV